MIISWGILDYNWPRIIGNMRGSGLSRSGLPRLKPMNDEEKNAC
jgi:hypothetical protein